MNFSELGLIFSDLGKQKQASAPSVLVRSCLGHHRAVPDPIEAEYVPDWSLLISALKYLCFSAGIQALRMVLIFCI